MLANNKENVLKNMRSPLRLNKTVKVREQFKKVSDDDI
jgi:hypothetical protein